MAENAGFYSVREAAQRIGQSEKELLRLAAAAGIPMFQERGQMVFKTEDIDWLAANPGSAAADNAGLFDLADLLNAASAEPPVPPHLEVLEGGPPSEEPVGRVSPKPVGLLQNPDDSSAGIGHAPGAGPSDGTELSASGLFDQAEIARAAGGPDKGRERSARPVQATGRQAAPADEVTGSSSGLFNLTDLLLDSRGDAQKTRPLEIDRVHRLFLDDAVLEHARGTNITYHQPVKDAGNPLVLPDTDWEQDGYCTLGGTVIYDHDEKQFKMWYSAMTKLGRAACVAVSRDGVKWKKPALGAVSYRTASTNLVMVHPVVDWYADLAGVHDEGPKPKDPKTRYKAAFVYANLRKGLRGLQTAVSPDGVNWEVPDKLALPQVRESAHLMYDEAHRKFVVWGCVRWYGKKALLRLESEDFQKWTGGEPVSWTGQDSSAGVDLHSMTVFPYSGLYLGLQQVIHGPPTNALDVALTMSRDGWEWRRVGNKPFLPLGQEGEWDRFAVACGAVPLRVGKELWFYYGGRNYRQVPPKGKVKAAGGKAEPWGAIGLARLRRDGFVSIGAAGSGWFFTKPLLLKGAVLHVNTAAAFGELRVRLTDLQGKVLDGMESNPISADEVDAAVTWPRQKSLEAYLGRPIRLEFRLKNARVYSFWTH